VVADQAKKKEDVRAQAEQDQKTYDALYREVYSQLYPRLRPLYRRIRAITGYPA